MLIKGEPIRQKLNRVVRDVLLRKYYIFKLYYGRAHAYVDLPTDLLMKFIFVTTWTKLWFPNLELFWFIPVYLISLVAFWFFGRWDVKNKNANLEHTVFNEINPQLWDTWNYIKEQKSKEEKKKVRKNGRRKTK